jgi:hypothetical protein
MKPTQENYDALSEFFRDQSFVRIAITSTKAVLCPPDIHTAKPAAEVLKKKIVEVAARSPFNLFIGRYLRKLRTGRPDH